MAVLNWGDLAKSSVDNETIEQAIARLIVQHNNDEESHLDTGQSLQSHKAAVIIDHLAGSILADKLSNKESLHFLPFESLDNYVKSATGVTGYVTGYKMETGTVLNTEKYLYVGSQYTNSYFNTNRSVTFQFNCSIGGTTNLTGYVCAGGFRDLIDPPGVGFKFVNGTLYAVECVYGEEAIEEYTYEITGITITSWNVYRIEYNGVTGQILYYVNGTLRYTATSHINFDVGLILFSSSIKTTNTTNKQMFIRGIYYSLDENPT